MSQTVPDVALFCCHYTSQQLCAKDEAEQQAIGFPLNIRVNRLSCSGKLKVSSLLSAFEEGADIVYVVGCPPDKCHNVAGSVRAEKRVMAVKRALEELGVEPERVEMFHLERGLHPEFVEVGRRMVARGEELGASPFKGDPS